MKLSQEEIDQKIADARAQQSERPEPNQQKWKREAKELIKEYSSKDLKFKYLHYHRSKTQRGTITIASLLDRDNNQVIVAFAFCSPLDLDKYDKNFGKLKVMERLSNGDSFTVDLAQVKTGARAITEAFNSAPKPRWLRHCKLSVSTYIDGDDIYDQ